MTNTSTQIEYFKKEAKRLFKEVQANEAEALARVQRVLKDSEDISLMRIQHVIAVEYGFSQWTELTKTPANELQSAIAKSKTNRSYPNGQYYKSSKTPLAAFLRGPGMLPTPPHLESQAAMLDKMSLEDQRRYLDEDARKMGFFNK